MGIRMSFKRYVCPFLNMAGKASSIQTPDLTKTVNFMLIKPVYSAVYVLDYE